MGKKCSAEWKKRFCGVIMLSVGVGMFLAWLLPSCIFFVATALICGGVWLLRCG